jgi:hypothetical protein
MDSSKIECEIKEEANNLKLNFQSRPNVLLFELIYDGKLLYKETPERIEDCISDFPASLSQRERLEYITNLNYAVMLLYKKIIEGYNIPADTQSAAKKIEHALADPSFHYRRFLLSLLNKVSGILTELFNKNRIHNISSAPGISLLLRLIDAGQIKLEDGKHRLYKKNASAFIRWCYDQGFIDEEKGKNNIDYITPEFIHKNIETGCTLETLRRYFREVQEPQSKRKPETPHKKSV